MKKLLLAAIFALSFAGYANAYQLATSLGGATANASPTANSSSGSVSSGGSAVAGTNTGANSQAITFNSSTPADTRTNVNYGGSYTVKNVPSVSGPPLTTSNDTCMGSASGSLNVTGIGVGFGRTYTDDNCVMLKNSREMWNYGMKGAALALMCQDPLNRKAIHDSYTPGGYLCPGDKPPETVAEEKRKTAAYIAAAQARQKQLHEAAVAATAAADQAAVAAKAAAQAADQAAAQAAAATKQADAAVGTPQAVQTASDSELWKSSLPQSTN